MSPSSTRHRHKPAGLFLAGTDTGVGKTFLASGLLRLAARRQTPLVPFKPAESGCPGGHPQDAAALLAASGLSDLTLAEVCPFPLIPAVAPAAATPARSPLRLSTLVRAAHSLAHRGPLLVESAGGLLSPYSRRFTVADLAGALALPVLLVARNALGTINHTALAVAELRRRGLPLVGVVLVTTQPAPNLAAQRNPELIAALTGLRPLAVLPHWRNPSTERVATWLAQTGVGSAILQRAARAAQHIKL
jgi:dethiobiotin synthetase